MKDRSDLEINAVLLSGQVVSIYDSPEENLIAFVLQNGRGSHHIQAPKGSLQQGDWVLITAYAYSHVHNGENRTAFHAHRVQIMTKEKNEGRSA